MPPTTFPGRHRVDNDGAAPRQYTMAAMQRTTRGKSQDVMSGGVCFTVLPMASLWHLVPQSRAGVANVRV